MKDNSLHVMIVIIVDSDGMIYSADDFSSVLLWKKRPLKWRLKMAAAMHAENERMGRAGKENRRRHRCGARNRGYALEEMDRLLDIEFIRMFRMTRVAFDSLEQLITPYVQRFEQAAINRQLFKLSPRCHQSLVCI